VHGPGQVVSSSTPRMPLLEAPPALPEIAKIKSPVAATMLRRLPMARTYRVRAGLDCAGCRNLRGSSCG
jgi:hypothetical protein